ncbi:5-dehydro-2-deoxygluconokinase [Streptomyces laculatispora]|uniref:5-dehydro-2-deoxygluconokinase n=1 Tax=Streptomyces laculatispora TaxID=887464 RepID=A0ABY9I824_9ACTN|nr:5-dehydro-2-deoxygluconokinase [Streptomyces laculatispora]WLQ43023.1 5-dehydro-2-deoxygluconokinase [Streptomyces laculatispora]
MPEPYDVITMGRIGVDLYPLQTGLPLARVDAFGKFLGGSPTNVAVAAARLGRRAAVVTRTGQDAFGEYLHQQLREFGVDDRWVTAVGEYPTPVTFCEIFPPDDFPLYFYRQPKAPDLEIHASELDLEAVGSARVFWMTGTGLCAEPSCSATLAALRARNRSGITVFDLDWRPMFWEAPPDATTDGSPEATTDGSPDATTDGPPGSSSAGTAAAGPTHPVASARYREALAHATVAVGNLDECEIATGEREPYAAARALLAAGVELAVVKQGPGGVLAVHRDGTVADVPPLPVEVVNGLGAGDAFGGALCHGLLAGWETARIMRYANAAGAIVASRLACSSAMPFPHEVEAALAAGSVTATPPRPGATAPRTSAPTESGAAS